MKDFAFVNLITPTGWYPKGQQRLGDSVRKHAPEATFIGYPNESAVGAPLHKVVPYAFKPYAIDHAQRRDHDRIIWLDASCWLIRPPLSICEKIKAQGHLFFYNCPAGHWTSDYCLDYFKVTREEAMQIPMIMACFMGLDLLNHDTCLLQQQYLGLAHDNPKLFEGSWNNANKTESQDPRCYGHRHDQSVMSLLIHRTNQNRPGTFKIEHRHSATDMACDYLSFSGTGLLPFEYASPAAMEVSEIVAQGL